MQPQIDAAPQSTSCTDQQVDINLANIDDLMRIIHIGEVRATELIQLRPSGTLDDLKRGIRTDSFSSGCENKIFLT